MSESLYLIEQTLSQLAEECERAQADGDQDAVAAMDVAIAAYLTQEARKVTSYVGLIRSREATARACNDEIERLQNIRAATVADIDRLKKTAMDVMNRFGVRELKATPGGGLRIQANGGLQPLELEGVLAPGAVLPEQFFSVTVTMPFHTWMAQGGLSTPGTTPNVKPDTAAIREALKRGESVPGAKLLDRGEHLRCL